MSKKKKIKVFVIHGGTTFRNRKDYLRYLKNKKVSFDKKINWTEDYLENSLGKRFHIVRPRMPLRENAKYEDWKIFFERYKPYLNGDFILIGNSLGSIFLAKYLSENELNKKALSVYLVCPPFDDTVIGEDLVGGFRLKNDLSLLEKNSKHLRLMFSIDDDVVPVSHAKKYASKLNKADIIIYKDKNGHFDVSMFPEIIRLIKQDALILTAQRR